MLRCQTRLPMTRITSLPAAFFAFLLWLLAMPGMAQSPNAVLTSASVLAPTGELRVGVYEGSPTSLVLDPVSGEQRGVAVELGRSLAARLGVPLRLVRFERVAQIIEALKANTVDMTFTNASAARALEVDFTPPLIQLELGLLVPAQSPIRQFADADRPGVRIGVSQGSSSQASLGRSLKQAGVVAVASMELVRQHLMVGELDAFATNKGILFELNERLSGFKVLPDRWGLENLAIAIPKGRSEAMSFLNAFASEQQHNGNTSEFARRAGLRGMVR